MSMTRARKHPQFYNVDLDKEEPNEALHTDYTSLKCDEICGYKFRTSSERCIFWARAHFDTYKKLYGHDMIQASIDACSGIMLSIETMEKGVSGRVVIKHYPSTGTVYINGSAMHNWRTKVRAEVQQMVDSMDFSQAKSVMILEGLEEEIKDKINVEKLDSQSIGVGESPASIKEGLKGVNAEEVCAQGEEDSIIIEHDEDEDDGRETQDNPEANSMGKGFVSGDKTGPDKRRFKQSIKSDDTLGIMDEYMSSLWDYASGMLEHVVNEQKNINTNVGLMKNIISQLNAKISKSEDRLAEKIEKKIMHKIQSDINDTNEFTKVLTECERLKQENFNLRRQLDVTKNYVKPKGKNMFTQTSTFTHKEDGAKENKKDSTCLKPSPKERQPKEQKQREEGELTDDENQMHTPKEKQPKEQKQREEGEITDDDQDSANTKSQTDDQTMAADLRTQSAHTNKRQKDENPMNLLIGNSNSQAVPPSFMYPEWSTKAKLEQYNMKGAQDFIRNTQIKPKKRVIFAILDNELSYDRKDGDTIIKELRYTKNLAERKWPTVEVYIMEPIGRKFTTQRHTDIYNEKANLVVSKLHEVVDRKNIIKVPDILKNPSTDYFREEPTGLIHLNHAGVQEVVSMFRNHFSLPMFKNHSPRNTTGRSQGTQMDYESVVRQFAHVLYRSGIR